MRFMALRELMDEIFGDDNFVATDIGRGRFPEKFGENHLSGESRYIVLLYARKNKESWGDDACTGPNGGERTVCETRYNDARRLEASE